jgi:2-amino-4-hydroxy-6-hydroxymethyldihydropteridine diphosphokinase
MARIILSLGSNVGEGATAIQQALGRLTGIVEDLKVSSLYRSVPMYVTDQPAFLNAVAIGNTDVGPLPLLRLVKEIETSLGRIERFRWGPREIDIDIVAYGSLVYRYLEKDGLTLQIPHPRFHERRFVLAPLDEISPNCIIPGKGSLVDLLAQTDHHSGDVVRERHELLSVRSKG